MVITIAQYYMGRDALYPHELTPQIRINAARTMQLVNALLEEAAGEGVLPGIDAKTNSPVGSGWRPAAVNDKTANAASKSKHLTADACDIRDTRGRDLARWCLRNLEVLERLGLWMEDPRWTPTWVHLQTVRPGSGKRVFRPSAAAPVAPPLPEQA